ncbi:MAG: class I SAM-dependent methyltransferase [Pseudomonadota bacterium]
MGHATGGDAAQNMDGIYKHQRFIYDATRKYFLLGRDHLIADLKPPPNGTILEVGCGTGRNLILAARKYPDAQLFGFDISEEMLTTARASIKRAGLSERIVVAQGDATNFDVSAMFGVPSVDRAFCSYTLSMIPPWEQVLPQSLEAVGADGRFHVVDFGQQAKWPVWFRSMLKSWLAKFTVHPRANLQQVMQSVADHHNARLHFEHLRGDYAQYGVLIPGPGHAP